VDRLEVEQEWTAQMRAALQGDETAYHQLLTSLSVSLRATVRRRLQRLGATQSETEDVVQEILLALHLKRNTWDPQMPLAPWIAAITRNKLVDAFRRRGRREEVPVDSVLESLQSSSVTEDSNAVDVDRLLSQLSEQQRSIVRAVALEGHSAQEAAAQLNMSEVAVRVSLHRSLKTLAARLRGAGGK
jgi:RNA polymerase sigma-70 factor (ECF subfamily)